MLCNTTIEKLIYTHIRVTISLLTKQKCYAEHIWYNQGNKNLVLDILKKPKYVFLSFFKETYGQFKNQKCSKNNMTQV